MRRNTLRRSLAVSVRAKVLFLGDKKRKLKINERYSLKSIDDHALCSPLTVLRQTKVVFLVHVKRKRFENQRKAFFGSKIFLRVD